MRDGRGDRFLRWSRLLPIIAMAAVLVACVVLELTPTSIGRSLLYPVSHVESIVDSSRRHGVDPYLACAVIKCESDWDEGAVSSAGAVGLMQVMPSTAQDLAGMGVVDASVWDPSELSDPATNIEYGCAYLAYLERNLSSTSEVIAAYNAGLGNVREWLADGGSIEENIGYAETSSYLERVTEACEGYRRAYPSGLLESGSTSER